MGNSVAATCVNQEEGAVDQSPPLQEEIGQINACGSYHGESHLAESEFAGDGVGLDGPDLASLAVTSGYDTGGFTIDEEPFEVEERIFDLKFLLEREISPVAAPILEENSLLEFPSQGDEMDKMNFLQNVQGLMDQGLISGKGSVKGSQPPSEYDMQMADPGNKSPLHDRNNSDYYASPPRSARVDSGLGNKQVVPQQTVWIDEQGREIRYRGAGQQQPSGRQRSPQRRPRDDSTLTNGGEPMSQRAMMKEETKKREAVEKALRDLRVASHEEHMRSTVLQETVAKLEKSQALGNMLEQRHQLEVATISQERDQALQLLEMAEARRVQATQQGVVALQKNTQKLENTMACRNMEAEPLRKISKILRDVDDLMAEAHIPSEAIQSVHEAQRELHDMMQVRGLNPPTVGSSGIDKRVSLSFSMAAKDMKAMRGHSVE
jgi:hypothetical protein